MTAKFQVIINDLDEKTLGPVLGALPNGIAPEIRRTSGRDKPPKPIMGGAIHTSKSKENLLESWINQMPQRFAAAEFIPHIEAAGHAPGSITHFLRRAIHAGLIRKAPGTAGTSTRYEKLKS